MLTALAGWRLARACGAEGGAWLAAMAVVACTGALALENGYGKASVEVACLTSIAAVGVARVARTGAGLGTVGAAVGLALLLHRSALGLVPAWAVCAALALRAEARRGRAAALAPRAMEHVENAPRERPAESPRPRFSRLPGLLAGLAAPPPALPAVRP